ncbi:MAG: division/cell wall cluster transcriptional repressor MraZ [Chitinivibrionales bacterium]|nr:division/cell wall cluster transcriptional repressor MraZ [Chitinivibrionales bacterium]
MSRFRGRFDYTIDAKGRINVPAKFRKALSPAADETFVICRGPDRGLRAYPQDAWEKFEDSLASLPSTPATEKMARQLFSTVSDSRLDSQGRIMLSPVQLKIGGITKEVTLIGRPGYIEIWDTARFNAYTGVEAGAEDGFDEAFYNSMQLGANAHG